MGGRTPAIGAMVREAVSIYAHFQRVRRLLGNPADVCLYFEQESAMRAACLTAWLDRIAAGACEAFYVRIAKDQTAREKEAIGLATRARIDRVMQEYVVGAAAARRILTYQALERGDMERRGPWNDLWLRHPAPTAFEPDKEVCRLTRRSSDEAEANDMAVGAPGRRRKERPRLGHVNRFLLTGYRNIYLTNKERLVR